MPLENTLENEMAFDVAIIGAGIVGLSVGYELSQRRPDYRIVIVDKEEDVAQHQTGNNSGVIHSGIYYKPGSSKAVNCIEGYNHLLEFCGRNSIPHEICGKVIVATAKEEEPILNGIYQRGIQNGLSGLEILNEDQIKEKEPYVRGTKGIWVPQTGIVDYKKVAELLLEILLGRNVKFILGNEIVRILKENGIYRLVGKSQDINSKFLVNCAGLYSDKIAKMDNINTGARIIPFRGEYYYLKPEKSYLVKNLIYPVPNPSFPFLGVHFTRRINGQIDAGPNAVLAFRREGYSMRDFDWHEFSQSLFYPGFLKVAAKYWEVGSYEFYRSLSKTAFTKALQKLIPDIRKNDLTAGNAGVRAQLCLEDGTLIDDFLIKKSDGAVHVLNAPSPAATASLQIGRTIVEHLENMSA
jgi:L-2-hydroxyglutarate oxidase